MKALLNTLTLNNPKQLIAPTVASFIENTFSFIPTMLSFFAVYEIGYGFVEPYTVNMNNLKMIGYIMLASVFLQFLIGLGSYQVTNIRTYKDSAKNRNKYTKRLSKLPIGFFNNKTSGEIINAFANDFFNFEQAMSFYLPQIISIGFFVILFAVFMFSYNISLAIAMYLPIPIIIVVLLFASRTKAIYTDRIIKAKDHAATALNEYLFGVKTLKSYKQAGSGFTKLNNAYKQLMKENIASESKAGTLTLVAINLVQFIIPLMTIAGAYGITKGNLSILDFIGLLIIATKMSGPFTITIISIIGLRSVLKSTSRIQQVMEQEALQGDKNLKTLRDITFDNVTFGYGDNPVLQDVSFTVRKNQLTALVGPSGCGKSTIIRLIARFWDIEKGVISSGGMDIREILPENWLNLISMVMQKTYLFHTSIRDNITFGNDKATEREVIEAAKKARCHDFIMELPDGYDTVVGEGGSTLSGGEKQRIAIARALLKDAPLVILDEPTASLDAENEMMIQKAIDELAKGRTVIMIAHHLNTIKHADQIIVLDDGRILGSGTHEELLSSNALYAKLVNLNNKVHRYS